MNQHEELATIRERYQRRTSLPASRYSRFSTDVLLSVQQRQYATVKLLAANDIQSLQGLDVFEIGCGGGSNLLEFLLLGATPERLVGNELITERLQQARSVLPATVRLLAGNAAELSIAESSCGTTLPSTIHATLMCAAYHSAACESFSRKPASQRDASRWHRPWPVPWFACTPRYTACSTVCRGCAPTSSAGSRKHEFPFSPLRPPRHR